LKSWNKKRQNKFLLRLLTKTKNPFFIFKKNKLLKIKKKVKSGKKSMPTILKKFRYTLKIKRYRFKLKFHRLKLKKNKFLNLNSWTKRIKTKKKNHIKLQSSYLLKSFKLYKNILAFNTKARFSKKNNIFFSNPSWIFNLKYHLKLNKAVLKKKLKKKN